MSINTGSFVYGQQNINFSILYVDRKTMEIAVLPDTSIVIKAPQHTVFEEIEKRVKNVHDGYVSKLIIFVSLNQEHRHGNI